ncbi:hypothetical protein FCM35_KLT04259 [Carex littledalei]|uniref:Uncharacterized protein n=1 Tax=Carex littledalei TaxID=544730 RepID=A0A833QPD3_9POAL|nr:hypothetical protein FCM35_KLT04259 [Carex littledalei]
MEKQEVSGAASPGVGAVSISDAIDELLRFTLSSTLSGDSDISDLALSSDFSSGLLLLDNAAVTTPHHFNDNEVGNGVPSYPLYKHLAKVLDKSFKAGLFPRREDMGTIFPPDDGPRIKETEWDKMISKTGFELCSMYGNVNFELNVQEPFFSQLKDRCHRNLFQGLGYDGIGRLLGMARTAGTVLDTLPPSRSVLASSAAKSYQPDVKDSALTDAARALAKHAERSSEGWWGHLQGNDSNKNQLASEVINRLLEDCCWMNIHLIQPYGPVFEIRVHEGYGARWSHNGSKFIGFLEPYTADGFSKGWKH